MPVFRKRIILNDFANLYIYLTVHRKFWKMLLSTTATSGDEIIHFSLFSVLYPEYCIIDPRNQKHNSIIFLCTLLTRVILSDKVFIFVQLSRPCFVFFTILREVTICINIHVIGKWDIENCFFNLNKTQL